MDIPSEILPILQEMNKPFTLLDWEKKESGRWDITITCLENNEKIFAVHWRNVGPDCGDVGFIVAGGIGSEWDNFYTECLMEGDKRCVSYPAFSNMVEHIAKRYAKLLEKAGITIEIEYL